MSSEDRFAEFEQRLDRLARDNQAMAEEIAHLRHDPQTHDGGEPASGWSGQTSTAVLERSPTADEEVVEIAADGAAIIDRRKALRSLGGLAVASVGLVAAGGMLRPLPAAAEAFTPLIIGEAQGGSNHSTRLTASPSNADQFAASTFAARNNAAAGSGRRIGLYGGVVNKGTGVYGEGLGGDTSTTSFGVYGYSDAAGAQSVSDRGAGVVGEGASAGAHGVWGRSPGVGVYAEGGNTQVQAVGLYARAAGGAPIVIEGSSLNTVPPVSGSWQAGALIAKDGELWFCKQGGAAAQTRWTPMSSNNLIILKAPDRVYDSRPNQAPSFGPQTPLSSGSERVLDMTVGGSVPSTASAVLVTATVIPTSGGRGFLTLWRQDQDRPSASNLNFNGDLPTAFATSATVALSGGSLRAMVGGATGGANLAIDVVGYYL